MIAKNFFQRFVYGCLVAAMPWVSAYQPATGHEAMKDVSKEISDLRSSIEFAEVYLVGREAVFRHDLTEHDVIRMTCRRAYVAREPGEKNELVDVLVNANLVETSADMGTTLESLSAST